MARPPSRFRSALAAVLLLSMIAPALAQAPLKSYAVYVDGTRTHPVAAYFDGAHTMVSLENIAQTLHSGLTKKGTTRFLHLADATYAFSPAQTTVTQDGELVMQTTSPPEERDHMLFVNIDDLQNLLSQPVTASGARIDIESAHAADNVHAVPLDHPRVSHYTVRSDSGSGGGGRGTVAHPAPPVIDDTNALVVHAAFSDYSGFRSRDLSFSTNGTRLRGNLDVAAFEHSSPALSGAVSIGTRDRFVQAGSQNNPVGGLVFDSPGGYGISLQRASSAFTTEHDSLGRTLIVARHDREDGATFYGMMRANGTTTTLLGDRQSHDGVVKVTREVWLSSGGAAASVSVATQGRLFGEAVVSQSVGNFPLTIGEAPNRLNLGFRASDRVTLRAGISSGYNLKASPYVGINFFGTQGTSGSLQFTGASRNAAISYAGARGSIAGTLSSSPDGMSWGLSGSLTAHRRLWEFSAFRSGTSEDDIVRTHTAGPGLILGLERIVSGTTRRIGPIFGITLPVGHTTSFEITQHPISSGRALGFGITQRIAFNPRVGMRTILVQNAAGSELYVDDRLVRRLENDSASVAITPGPHRVQARSPDGMRASLPNSVDEKTARVDATLLPVRAIAGRVVQTDVDPAGRKVSLEHIQVELEPGDLIVETEPDGTFVFPATPTAAGARVSIVRDSLPDGLEIGDDAPADAPKLELDVKTKIKIHHKKF